MGKPVNILSIAKKMINLSGLREKTNGDSDIEIKFIGLRKGEKMHEELVLGNNLQPTNNSKISKSIEEYYPLNEIMMIIDEIKVSLKGSDSQMLLILKKYINILNIKCISMTQDLLIFVIFLILNLCIYYNFSSLRRLLNVYDEPDNIRKIHSKKIAVLGGLIIYFNLCLVAIIKIIYPEIQFFQTNLINSNRNFIAFFGISSALFLIGLYDDKYSIRATKIIFVRRCYISMLAD